MSKIISQEENLSSLDSSVENDITDDENPDKKTNYDVMLDDYEKYVDQYITFYKDAMNGDQNALIEYPKFMQKANNLQQSMKAAENSKDLTTKQMKRMNDINFKMMEVIENQGNY